MIQEGLVSVCLWGKRVRIIRKARTYEDMDGYQANSKKILPSPSEDKFNNNTVVFKQLFKTK